MSKANYYAVVPYPVLSDSRLTDFEKLLYAVISGLANSKGYCFATNAYFMGFFSKSERTIQYGISKLTKLEYIYLDINQDDGNSRKIYIVKPDTPGAKNCVTPGAKNGTTHSYNKSKSLKTLNNHDIELHPDLENLTHEERLLRQNETHARMQRLMPWYYQDSNSS